MEYKASTHEEEKYLQTKETIVHNLYDQRETEYKYLDTIKNLLDYWKKEFKK